MTARLVFHGLPLRFPETDESSIANLGSGAVDSLSPPLLRVFRPPLAAPTNKLTDKLSYGLSFFQAGIQSTNPVPYH